MAELDVALNVLKHLVDQDLAVEPKDADGVNPVVIHDPKDGAPIPVGDYAGGTITLTTLGEPSSGEDHSRLKTVVAFNVRAPTNAQARLIIRSIQAVFTPLETWGGLKQFQMGDIDPVERCIPFRGASRTAVDKDGYQWDLAYEYEVRRKVLSGLTYP